MSHLALFDPHSTPRSPGSPPRRTPRRAVPPSAAGSHASPSVRPCVVSGHTLTNCRPCAPQSSVWRCFPRIMAPPWAYGTRVHRARARPATMVRRGRRNNICAADPALPGIGLDERPDSAHLQSSRLPAAKALPPRRRESIGTAHRRCPHCRIVAVHCWYVKQHSDWHCSRHSRRSFWTPDVGGP